MKKRTREIAYLLILSLLFSSLSATPAYATGILEAEETAELQEIQEPEETAESEVKMAGSDGIFYDDVLYLSARNVMAMNERMQARYRRLCDEIAAAKNDGVEIENVTFAMDADGVLHCSYSVSMRGLNEINAELLSNLEEASVLDLETEEESLLLDTKPEKDNENPDEANPDSGEEAAENKDEADSEEEENAVGNNDEANPAEEEDAVENKNETSLEEEKDAVENKDETNPEGKKDTIENSDEADSEDEEEAEKKDDGILNGEDEAEEFTVFEENMEKLSKPEAETFDVVEPVEITDVIKLEYSGFGADGIQAYSLLPSEDYFRAQLTDIQKTVYDVAKDTLLKGVNQFTVTAQDSSEIGWDDVTHAVQALMLAYPGETDWMANPRVYDINSNISESAESVTATFGKSKYYSASLESQAQEKVEKVGRLAVQYAIENYPDVLTYGVVKYLDQWVCENGYYTDDFYDIPDPSDEQLEQCYECHTAYGILLKGYGVCEGYAKTMSRLLDAVGIPNLFVIGDWEENGQLYGHAWNYVQMPNGNWYLLDSTYNDASGPISHKKSTGQYLLVKNNGKYLPDGNDLYERNETKFIFPTLADSNYDAGSEYDADSDYGNGNGTITLNKTECNLIPRGKETLTYTISGDWDYSGVSSVWSSSDTKVAKVDKKGVVTAVAPGTATIFLTASGMAAECKINVDQVKSMKVESTGKTSENVSLGIDGGKKDKKTIALTVDMGKSSHTAEWMIQQKKASAPQAVCSKQSVKVTDVSVSGNRITVTLEAASQGNSNVSVKFAGKKVTLKVAAGQFITEDMFNVMWPDTVKIEGENRTTPYTGKAVRPVVKKKTDAQYKKVTFKTAYVHNKDAGTAKIVVTGRGKYGGTIEYPFVITPLDITNADFSKALKNKVYNGGSNPPATVVKLNKKVLKAGRDYEILYNNETESDIKAKNGGAIPAGSYTVTINGIGNYTGKVSKTQSYTVTTNTIAKVKVAGAGKTKYTGMEMKPYTVKIGKNVLPGTDYKITWYKGQGKKRNASPMKTAPAAKGKFTAVITVEGGNLTETNKKKEIVKNFTIY